MALCKHFLCVQSMGDAVGCTLCAHAESPILKKLTDRGKGLETHTGPTTAPGACSLGSLNTGQSQVRASLGAQTLRNPPANAGDGSLIPGSGRSPGEGDGHLLQYSCLDNPVYRGAWWATVHGFEEELKKRRKDGSAMEQACYTYLAPLQTVLQAFVFFQFQISFRKFSRRIVC